MPRRLAWAAPRLTLAQPFVFIHMEKTGGTTIRLLTANQLLGQSPIYYTSHSARSGTTSRTVIMCHGMPCTDVQLAHPSMLNRTACAIAFVGHFAPLPLFETLVRIDRGEFGDVCCQRWPGLSPPRSRVRRLSAAMANALAWKAFEHALTATVLREPLSRATSHFYYFAYQNTSDTWRSKPFTNLSFGEYASAFGGPRTIGMSNGHRQLHLLSAVWGVTSSTQSQCNPLFKMPANMQSKPTQNETSRAKKVLSAFDVVGTIEHLDVLLKKLAQIMPRIPSGTALHTAKSGTSDAVSESNSSGNGTAKLNVNERYAKKSSSGGDYARLVQANRTQIQPQDREALLAELEPDMELYMDAKLRSGPDSDDAFHISAKLPWSARWL